jgi:hypothetical protein
MYFAEPEDISIRGLIVVIFTLLTEFLKAIDMMNDLVCLSVYITSDNKGTQKSIFIYSATIVVIQSKSIKLNNTL